MTFFDRSKMKDVTDQRNMSTDKHIENNDNSHNYQYNERKINYFYLNVHLRTYPYVSTA